MRQCEVRLAHWESHPKTHGFCVRTFVDQLTENGSNQTSITSMILFVGSEEVCTFILRQDSRDPRVDGKRQRLEATESD